MILKITMNDGTNFTSRPNNILTYIVPDWITIEDITSITEYEATDVTPRHTYSANPETRKLERCV